MTESALRDIIEQGIEDGKERDKIGSLCWEYIDSLELGGREYTKVVRLYMDVMESYGELS